MILVMMGVTGTGKTTVASAIAAQTGWEFVEGDDYHPAGNVQKLHDGIPLNDQDREPWLQSLHAKIVQWAQAGKNGIMTCSALKQSYRDLLAGDLPPGTVRFVLLQASHATLETRLAHRKGHFMNPHLLDSQLATLEDPPDALHISVEGTSDEAVQQITAALHLPTRPA